MIPERKDPLDGNSPLKINHPVYLHPAHNPQSSQFKCQIMEPPGFLTDGHFDTGASRCRGVPNFQHLGPPLPENRHGVGRLGPHRPHLVTADLIHIGKVCADRHPQRFENGHKGIRISLDLRAEGAVVTGLDAHHHGQLGELFLLCRRHVSLHICSSSQKRMCHRLKCFSLSRILLLNSFCSLSASNVRCIRYRQ